MKTGIVMKKTAIIGGGFSGIMTAVRLIEKSTEPCEIVIVDERFTMSRGIAYTAYSKKHLLNVVAGKMGAYPDNPEHFLDWVMTQPGFKEKDRTLISNAFLSRKLYGNYLAHIWKNALSYAVSKNIVVTLAESFVTNLDITEKAVLLSLNNSRTLAVDYCVIATGNNLPGNPKIKNRAFYKSKNYFQNPWHIASVKNTGKELPVLIIGNGLTMVDTVLGLLEEGFKGKIYAVSPNGFNILPHRHSGIKYTKLVEELPYDVSLFELVKLVNKHIKIVREYGITAEPVIDSLRPYTQKIWKRLTINEKQVFVSRLRHLWSVARHRIPLHIHDMIQRLRMEGKLHTYSGKIIDFTESAACITLEFFDKKETCIKHLKVSRVINCTGPETNLMNLDKSFLKNCLLKGILGQDPLKLGIHTDTETFQVIDTAGRPHTNLFTLGSNLKGGLWESTAVKELREQAEKIAAQLKNLQQSKTKSIEC